MSRRLVLCKDNKIFKKCVNVLILPYLKRDYHRNIKTLKFSAKNTAIEFKHLEIIEYSIFLLTAFQDKLETVTQ